MKCRAAMVDSQNGYWINWEKFFPDCVNMPDYLARDNSLYDRWFLEPDNEIQVFVLPKILFRNGQAKWINGRHRTELLARYMNGIIPVEISINHPSKPEPPPKEIIERELYNMEIFELPDAILETYKEILKKQ